MLCCSARGQQDPADFHTLNNFRPLLRHDIAILLAVLLPRPPSCQGMADNDAQPIARLLTTYNPSSEGPKPSAVMSGDCSLNGPHARPLCCRTSLHVLQLRCQLPRSLRGMALYRVKHASTLQWPSSDACASPSCLPQDIVMQAGVWAPWHRIADCILLLYQCGARRGLTFF